MNTSRADALVFFGATGARAYKQIFPALQALVKRHNLDLPIIGVAKSGWNLEQLRSVQITMAEDFGVQGRGKFYEEAGAIRDVAQNHLLQVPACLAMDAPAGEGPDAIRDVKARVLKAVHPRTPSDVVRGQFRGYREEEGVAPDSRSKRKIISEFVQYGTAIYPSLAHHSCETWKFTGRLRTQGVTCRASRERGLSDENEHLKIRRIAGRAR